MNEVQRETRLLLLKIRTKMAEEPWIEKAFNILTTNHLKLLLGCCVKAGCDEDKLLEGLKLFLAETDAKLTDRPEVHPSSKS